MNVRIRQQDAGRYQCKNKHVIGVHTEDDQFLVGFQCDTPKFVEIDRLTVAPFAENVAYPLIAGLFDELRLLTSHPVAKSLGPQ